MRDRTIRDNTFYQLNCMSMGGNPPATLKWFLSGSRKEVNWHSCPSVRPPVFMGIIRSILILIEILVLPFLFQFLFGGVSSTET
jgi:hypothetical protein